MAYERGDIVLVPFPFTNLSGSKARPALVVSGTRFSMRDLVLAAISSQKRPANDPLAVEIPTGTPQFEQSGLRRQSTVLVGKLMTLDQELPYMRLGRADGALLREVEKRLAVLFELATEVERVGD